MIPKIIHLCWLSGDPYPEDVKICLDSWKINLPDYDIWVWDTSRFDVNSTIWTKQAFENRKYAFAADYIRLYALYNYGGIYLDSDVIVYKSFDSLLQLPYFIGQSYSGAFEAAVIGAEKKTPWIGDILKRYDNRSFVKEDKSFDMIELPKIFTITLEECNYKFYRLHSIEDYGQSSDCIYVFDKDFFNSRNSIEVQRTNKSFCAHNYLGSWTQQQKTTNSIKLLIKKIFPKSMIIAILNTLHNTILRRQTRKFEPKFENE